MAINLTGARFKLLGVLEARQAQKIAAMRGTGVNYGQLVIAGLPGRPLNLSEGTKLEIKRLPDGGLTGLISPENEAEIRAHFTKVAEARRNGLLPEDPPVVRAALQEIREMEAPFIKKGKMEDQIAAGKNPFVPDMPKSEPAVIGEEAKGKMDALMALIPRLIDDKS